MSYQRKTIDRCSEYTYREARQTLKEYRENGSGVYRLEKHREPKNE